MVLQEFVLIRVLVYHTWHLCIENRKGANLFFKLDEQVDRNASNNLESLSVLHLQQVFHEESNKIFWRHFKVGTSMEPQPPGRMKNKGIKNWG